MLNVMVAGIAGASLGTELLKSLRLAGRYRVFGCDIASSAFGHYHPGFERTVLVDRGHYVDSVIAACQETECRWLVPGGEQPMVLLAAARGQFDSAGIGLVANDSALVARFSDKAETFATLAEMGIPIPRTVAVGPDGSFGDIVPPCIVKPATGSGGSAMVFLAADREEAQIYADYIRRAGSTPVAQDYVGLDEGEFTVGVISTADGSVATSTALRRSLDSKLSVMSRSRGGVISSGYTQGYIGAFQGICAQAEAIAARIGSRGAINVQGRVRDGIFLPFEINPRLSASTYLRAMAGHNEVDYLLQNLAFGAPIPREEVREGWYLRTLSETFVAAEAFMS